LLYKNKDLGLDIMIKTLFVTPIRKIAFTSLSFCFVLTLVHCGYHFAGAGNLPGGIKSVAITVLENRTVETGAENIFTNALIYEFTRSGQATVTDVANADAVLSGIIERLSITTASRTGTLSVLERRITAYVALKLKNQDGEVIWAATSITADETYEVADMATIEQNKREAIVRLSERLAEVAYNQMTEDF
jgi:outer membrane lipopolysaccharide assembly protein LptE/RlpB